MFKKFNIFVLAAILIFSVCGCSFTTTTVNKSENNSAQETITQNENAAIESVEYEITKVDKSFRNAKDEVLIENSYDLVTIKGDNESFKKINNHFKKLMDSKLLSEEEGSGYLQDEYLSPDDPFSNSWSASVSYNQDGVFVISTGSYWFMGGVNDGSSFSVAYDLNTGETLKLNQLMGMSANDAVIKLRGIAYSGLVENYGDEFFDSDRPQKLSEYKIDDYKYYIKDGQIILSFQKYEFACGASGPSETPTGIYINK